MTVVVALSGLGLRVVVDEVILDRGEFAESALPSSAIVSVFDPDDDLNAEIVAGLPGVPVEDVLLEQREE